jgi:hypothetical protein
MERHRPSGLLALGTSACLLLGATGSDAAGSWWSERIDGVRALGAVAIGSPWAWCALIVLLATGVAVTHRLLGGPLLVLLSGLAAFVLGPDATVFPWTGVTVTMLLTESPRVIAEVALTSVTEARGATTESLYSLGMLFGLFCSLLLVAHLRGARFASDLSLTERPGAIQMLLLPESRPAAGLTPWQRRILRHALLATVTTTVVVSAAFSSLWWVFREREVLLLVMESRLGTLADPTRPALVGGWYPAAFWAVPLVGVAAGAYLAGKVRFVHGDSWQLATPVAIGVSWLAGLVAAIVVLFVPSGVLVFLSGFTIFAALLTPVARWEIPPRPPRDRSGRRRWSVGDRALERARAAEQQQRDAQQLQALLEALRDAERKATPQAGPGAAAPSRPGVPGSPVMPPGMGLRTPAQRPAASPTRTAVAVDPAASTLVAHPRPIVAAVTFGEEAYALLEEGGRLTAYRGGIAVHELRAPGGERPLLVANGSSPSLYLLGQGDLHAVETDAWTTSRIAQGLAARPVAAALNPLGACVAVAGEVDAMGRTPVSAVFVAAGATHDLGSVLHPVRDLAFSEDSRTVALLGPSGQLTLIDLATRTHRQLLLDGITDATIVAPAGHGRWLLVAGTRLQLLDVEHPEARVRCTVARKAVAAAAAPDASVLAVGSARGKVEIRGGPQLDVRFDGQLHDDRVLTLHIDTHGVVSCGADGTIRRLRP